MLLRTSTFSSAIRPMLIEMTPGRDNRLMSGELCFWEAQQVLPVQLLGNNQSPRMHPGHDQVFGTRQAGSDLRLDSRRPVRGKDSEARGQPNKGPSSFCAGGLSARICFQES